MNQTDPWNMLTRQKKRLTQALRLWRRDFRYQFAIIVATSFVAGYIRLVFDQQYLQLLEIHVISAAVFTAFAWVTPIEETAC
jgi:hypothetical protein